MPLLVAVALAPQELIAGGLYKDLARSCFPGRHREARARPLAAWWALTGRRRTPRCSTRLPQPSPVGVARAPRTGSRRDSGQVERRPPIEHRAPHVNGLPQLWRPPAPRLRALNLGRSRGSGVGVGGVGIDVGIGRARVAA